MRFKSVCRNVVNDVYKKLIRINVQLNGKKYKFASGQIGIKKRKIPYKPNFNNNAAKIIDPLVGASTWASGNHKWNGIIGIFTEKPKKSKNQIINCLFSKKKLFKKKSNDKLPLFNHISNILIKTNIEPNNV